MPRDIEQTELTAQDHPDALLFEIPTGIDVLSLFMNTTVDISLDMMQGAGGDAIIALIENAKTINQIATLAPHFDTLIELLGSGDIPSLMQYIDGIFPEG